MEEDIAKYNRDAWNDAINLNIKHKDSHINQLTDDLRVQRYLVLIRKKEQLRYK